MIRSARALLVAATVASIALVPDTQNYSEKFPDTYLAQTEWIRDVAAERRVVFAIHLGFAISWFISRFPSKHLLDHHKAF